MAEWLRQWQLRNMKCTVHDLEIMGSNPGWVELRMHCAQLYFNQRSLVAEWLNPQFGRPGPPPLFV